MEHKPKILVHILIAVSAIELQLARTAYILIVIILLYRETAVKGKLEEKLRKRSGYNIFVYNTIHRLLFAALYIGIIEYIILIREWKWW